MIPRINIIFIACAGVKHISHTQKSLQLLYSDMENSEDEEDRRLEEQRKKEKAKRKEAEKLIKVQGHQLNMTVFFWYL